MNYKKTTLFITIASILVLGIYDFFAVFVGGTESSISHLVITASKDWPIIPFLVGGLMGHFYFPMRITKEILEQLKHIDLLKVEDWCTEIIISRQKDIE
jgi:hypothetical protein